MSGEADALETRLAALDKAIEASTLAIRQGETVDLTGLQSEIGDICVEMVNARPDSKRFLPRLEALTAELDTLAAELKRHFETAG